MANWWKCENVQICAIFNIKETFYALEQKCKIRSNYLSIDVDGQFLPCGEGIILDLLLRDALKVAADILGRVGNPHALLGVIGLLLLGLPDVVLHLQLKKFDDFAIIRKIGWIWRVDPKDWVFEKDFVVKDWWELSFTQGDGSGSGPLVFLIWPGILAESWRGFKIKYF